MRWTLQQIDTTASATTITLTTIKDEMEDVAPQSLRWAWFFISKETWAFQTVKKPRPLTFLFQVPQLGVIFKPEHYCCNKKYINYENNSINSENTFEGVKQADSAECRRPQSDQFGTASVWSRKPLPGTQWEASNPRRNKHSAPVTDEGHTIGCTVERALFTLLSGGFVCSLPLEEINISCTTTEGCNNKYPTPSQSCSIRKVSDISAF